MENNYKTCITPAKEDAVKVLREEFSKYNGFIFTEYRGMTVSQMTALRTQLRENDAQYKVVKNRFAKLALKDLGINGADESLVGPVALALAKGDESNVVAKKLYAAIKDGVPMVVTGAIVDNELMNAAEIEAFSKLPTRLELIASLMGTMKAPVQKLAATLLAYVESKGGATASAEAPAEN